MGATRQMRRQIGSPTPNAERSAARTHRQWPRSSKACQHRDEAVVCPRVGQRGGARGGQGEHGGSSLHSRQETNLSRGPTHNHGCYADFLPFWTGSARPTARTQSHADPHRARQARNSFNNQCAPISYTRAPVHKHHGRHMMELTPKPNIPFTGFLVRLRTVMRTMWLEVGHGHHLSHHGFEQRDGKAKSAPTNRLPCLWR